MRKVTDIVDARLKRVVDDMRQRFAGHPPPFFSWLISRAFADALEQCGMVRERRDGRDWLVDPTDPHREPIGVMTAREEAEQRWEEAHAPPEEPKPMPTEGVAPGAWWAPPAKTLPDT